MRRLLLAAAIVTGVALPAAADGFYNDGGNSVWGAGYNGADSTDRFYLGVYATDWIGGILETDNGQGPAPIQVWMDAQCCINVSVRAWQDTGGGDFIQVGDYTAVGVRPGMDGQPHTAEIYVVVGGGDFNEPEAWSAYDGNWSLMYPTATPDVKFRVFWRDAGPWWRLMHGIGHVGAFVFASKGYYNYGDPGNIYMCGTAGYWTNDQSNSGWQPFYPPSLPDSNSLGNFCF